MTELLTGLLGVLVGGLLVHRFALFRDQRKEYNEAITPFLKFLIKAEEQANSGYIWIKWDDDELLNTKLKLSNSKKVKLEKLIEAYQSSIRKAYPVNKEKPWEGAMPVRQEFEKIVDIINEIKTLLKVK